MEHREMEYVIVIAQERNLSKAAERLFISQPALSRFLVKLENDLGTPLFERKNRQYFPTMAGELYLDTAREILRLQQQFNAELKSLIQTSRGVISMGITPGRGHTILPHVLPAFREYFPDYEIQVHEENVDTLEQYLMNGTIEVAFFTVLEKSRLAQKCYTCELLSREELVICTPRKGNYELLAKAVSGRRYPWIDLKDLENDCFLTLKKNMRLGQFSAAILEKYQIEPRVVELSTIDTALALVARQYGVAFASGYRINEHEYANEISVFSFGDQPELWDFVAAYKNDTPLKQPVRQLIRLVSEFS
jgi:DNA-binding transcriptional LysR family regulator